jgi:hypothetical protein
MAAYLTYNHQSEEMAQRYEDLSFEQVHRDILSELPPKGATVLVVDFTLALTNIKGSFLSWR